MEKTEDIDKMVKFSQSMGSEYNGDVNDKLKLVITIVDKNGNG